MLVIGIIIVVVIAIISKPFEIGEDVLLLGA